MRYKRGSYSASKLTDDMVLLHILIRDAMDEVKPDADEETEGDES